MSRELELIDGGDPIRHQAARWFARLRADDVSEVERRQWQSWLDADPRHRQGYQRIERLWSTLGTHAPAPEIAGRLDAIAPAPVHAATGAMGRRRRFTRFALAATLAMAAIAGWRFWPVAGDAAPLEYATTVGEQRRLTLQDGTRITLDTDTRLRVEYSAQARRLVLDQGRAYFEVARERRPLTVHTEHGSVRALGTEFEVYRHAHDTDVALVHGKVMLASGDTGTGDPGDVGIAMEAGHGARLAGGTGTPRIEPLNMGYQPPWLSGRLVFEDTALPDVVAEFNRYSHRQIVLADAGLAEIHVTGVFRSDGMQAFVHALRDAYPVAVDASRAEVVRLSAAGPATRR